MKAKLLKRWRRYAKDEFRVEREKSGRYSVCDKYGVPKSLEWSYIYKDMVARMFDTEEDAWKECQKLRIESLEERVKTRKNEKIQKLLDKKYND
jgi:hypothetical protein